MGMLNAMHLGDVLNDLIYQIRPFEVNKGETDRVFRETVDDLCNDLQNRHPFEIMQRAPDWAKPKFKSNKILRNTATSSARCTSTSGARTITKRWQPPAPSSIRWKSTARR